MKIISLLGHSGELLRIINKSPQPADKIAVEFFRSKKYIGSNDRRFISSIVFSSLRNKSRNEWLFECVSDFEEKEIKTLKDFFVVLIQNWFNEGLLINDSREWIDEINDFLSFKFSILKPINYKFFIRINKYYLDEKEKFLSLLEKINSNIDLTPNDESTNIFETIERLYSFPAWASKKLFEVNPNPNYNFIYELAESLLYPAPLVLRVNRNVATRAKIIDELNKLDIIAELDELSPDGLVIKERAKVTDTYLYKSGLIEVQDSASQLLAFTLNPSEKMKILDACAGAGGKSLHIATLQNDQGEIYSHDIEYQRLKEIKYRAERAGLRSIITTAPKSYASDEIDAKHPKQFDAVVIDAPCSGFGTLRRSPNIKWKMPERGFEKIVNSQYEILKHYSQFVRVGGILLYATCSIMPHENEENIKRFLIENKEFSPEILSESLNHYGIEIQGLKEKDYYITLYPSIHKSDGFFIAKMRRIL